jgi:hypothetical protein
MVAQARQVVITIEGNIIWQFAQDMESDGQWVGVCRPLNLTVAGASYGEVQEAAVEAMSELFADLLESKELDAFLQNLHWTRRNGEIPPGVKPRFEAPYRSERREARELLAAMA